MHAGRLVPISDWWALQERPKRSPLPKPFIVTDGIDATLNHADGRTYESRSSYYRALREKDCHIVETGEHTDKPREFESPGGLEQDIKDAMEQLGAI
jgi:hypothetical protein